MSEQILDPTQQELNRLAVYRTSSTFNEEEGFYVLPNGMKLPCCEGCGAWPFWVRPTSYPDPMGAPATVVNHLVCSSC